MVEDCNYKPINKQRLYPTISNVKLRMRMNHSETKIPSISGSNRDVELKFLVLQLNKGPFR